MTIEEFMTKELEYQSAIVEQKYEIQIQALRAKLEMVKQAMWQTHKDTLSGELKENNATANTLLSPSATDNTKKETSAKSGTAVAANENSNSRAINPKLPVIRIKCIGTVYGDVKNYIGQEWVLQPTAAKPCKIGRSQNLHFVKKGISLSSDLEVSTTHGQFGISKTTNKPYYMDLGSSNGTKFVGDDSSETLVNPHVEYELAAGAVLLFGACFLQIC